MKTLNASDCELLQPTCFSNREQADVPDVTTRRLFADESAIRAAIADVIDGGWQCGNSCDLRHPWRFKTEMFSGDEQPTDADIEHRTRFMDAVCARLATLQSHGLALRIEDYCNRHKRVRMFTSEKCCPDCTVEGDRER